MARRRRPDALPDLFDAGWSRVRGGRSGARQGGSVGARLRRGAQMVRAARGHSPAVFKAIRNGGCHSAPELVRQLTYLTTKSSLLFDAFGRHDGQARLSPSEIAAMTKRFAQTWNPKAQSRLGHTTHLLMSFPIGTDPQAVAGVARRVCEQFFHGGEGRPAFDYIVAVHADRAHTHAHVVVNRRSPDGATFYLRSGHQWSYELFREAMAEHGDAFGLRLEATRRVDRGLTTLDARSLAVRQARAVGLEASERPRVGEARERAAQAVADASLTYRGLALAASQAGFAAVSEALHRASLVLARHGAVLPTKELAMTDTSPSFDGLVRELATSVEELEARIACSPDTKRPMLERGLSHALATIADLQPIGERSATLNEPPSPDGLYSQARGGSGRPERLRDSELRARVEAALAGTGLSTSEVLARVRIGADNAALEDHWHARDMAAVAASLGLDLDQPDHEDRVMDRLEAAYDAVDDALEAAGVRGAVASHDAPRHDRPSVPATPGSDQAMPARRSTPTDDQGAAGHDAHTGDTATERVLRETASRLRDQRPRETAFETEADAAAFRAALARRLAPDERARLDQGDVGALDRLALPRIDALALAKAHLDSGPVPADPAVRLTILNEIVAARLAAQRGRDGHEEEGATHD